MARRGNPHALSELAGPEFPEEIEYLWEWFMELDRTRTVGMNGPDGFTYPMIDAWARLTDQSPQPHEVEALFALDVVRRHPAAGEER